MGVCKDVMNDNEYFILETKADPRTVEFLSRVLELEYLDFALLLEISCIMIFRTANPRFSE